MSTTHLTPVEPGNRIQLPTEWADALGLRQRVILDRTSEGILVRPCPPATWAEIFATRLAVGAAPADPDADAVEVTGDDLLI